MLKLDSRERFKSETGVSKHTFPSGSTFTVAPFYPRIISDVVTCIHTVYRDDVTDNCEHEPRYRERMIESSLLHMI